MVGLRSLEQEPADERNPQPAEIVSHQEREESTGDENRRHHLTDACGDARSAMGIMRQRPHDRPQYSTAVEGKSWNQIEERERDIDEREPAEHRRKSR